MAVVQRRIRLLGGAQPGRKTLSTMKSLRAFSLGRLFEALTVQEENQVTRDEG